MEYSNSLQISHPDERRGQDDPAAAILLLNRSLTVGEWAELIRTDLRKGAAAYVAAGQNLIRAKQQLKENGDSFIRLVEKELGWDLDSAERWMKIAKNSALADSANLRNLPTAWTTLFTLSRVPPKTLQGFIDAGKVHSRLRLKGAEALVGQSHQRPRKAKTVELSTEEPAEEPAEELIKESAEELIKESAEEHESDPNSNGSTAPVDASTKVGRDDIGSNSRCEADRRLARLEELEREKRQWDIQRHGYESEIEELRAKLGPETTLRHPRRLFRRALEDLQKSEAPKLMEKDRRALINSALMDLVELVRSLERDGLKVQQLDLFFRAVH